MPKRSVLIDIAADNSRLEKELAKATKQLNYFKRQADRTGRGSANIFSPLANNVKTASGPLGGVATKFSNIARAGAGLAGPLAGAAIGFAGLAEAVTFIDEGLEKLKALTAATKRLSRETGMSSETASAWIGVAQRFGVSSDQLSTQLGFLSKRIAATSGNSKSATTMLQLFARAGVSPMVLASKNMDRILVALATRFKAMPDGVVKTDLAMKLFGRSGKNLIPVLNQGGKGVGALKREMASLGLTISGNTVKKVTQLTKAQNTLKQVWNGLQIQLAQGVIPWVAKFASAFRDAAVGLRTGHRPTKQMASDLYDLGAALRDVANAIVTIARAYNEARSFFNSPVGKALRYAAGNWVMPGGGNIAAHATGGIIGGPQLSLIGEDGPEAVIPLSQKYRARGAALYAEAGRQMGLTSGGNTFVVNNYGNQLDEAQLASRWAWQLKTRTA